MYYANGLLQLVAPNVHMRERCVEAQAVRDGAKAFRADVVRLERQLLQVRVRQHQRFSNVFGSVVLQPIVAQIEQLESRVALQILAQMFGAVSRYPIAAQIQMEKTIVVDELLAEPLGAIVSHLILLHVQFDHRRVDFQHYCIVLRDLVHPVGELVLRNGTVDVERENCFVVV